MLPFIIIVSSFITPYRKHKNTYCTHTMNAIYTIKTKNTKRDMTVAQLKYGITKTAADGSFHV